MINERILEYLILADIENSSYVEDEFKMNGKIYSMNKIRERLEEIRQEALEPYVINSDSKE